MAPRYFRCQLSRQDIPEPPAWTRMPPDMHPTPDAAKGPPGGWRSLRTDTTRNGGGFLIPVVCIHCGQSPAISQTVILDIYYRI